MPDYERYNEMTLPELINETHELVGTLENEKFFMKNATDHETARAHSCNVGGLQYDLDVLKELIINRCVDLVEKKDDCSTFEETF